MKIKRIDDFVRKKKIEKEKIKGIGGKVSEV